MDELLRSVCGNVLHVEASGLEIVKRGTTVRFTVLFARGHPRFDVILVDLSLPHVTGTDIHDAVRELEGLQHFFGIRE